MVQNSNSSAKHHALLLHSWINSTYEAASNIANVYDHVSLAALFHTKAYKRDTKIEKIQTRKTTFCRLKHMFFTIVWFRFSNFIFPSITQYKETHILSSYWWIFSFSATTLSHPDLRATFCIFESSLIIIIYLFLILHIPAVCTAFEVSWSSCYQKWRRSRGLLCFSRQRAGWNFVSLKFPIRHSFLNWLHVRLIMARMTEICHTTEFHHYLNFAK